MLRWHTYFALCILILSDFTLCIISDFTLCTISDFVYHVVLAHINIYLYLRSKTKNTRNSKGSGGCKRCSRMLTTKCTSSSFKMSRPCRLCEHRYNFNFFAPDLAMLVSIHPPSSQDNSIDHHDMTHHDMTWMTPHSLLEWCRYRPLYLCVWVVLRCVACILFWYRYFTLPVFAFAVGAMRPAWCDDRTAHWIVRRWKEAVDGGAT